MKKVFFVSAIMCMAMVAFVACKKDNGNDPTYSGGGSGGNGSGMCTCYALGENLGDFESGSMTCAQLAQATMDAMGGMYTVTCNPK